MLCPGVLPAQNQPQAPSCRRLHRPQENIVPSLPREVRHPLADRLFTSFEPNVGYVAGPELRASYPADF